MTDVAAIKANCSSCVENYHVCEMICHWVPGCYEADFVCVVHCVREQTCM